MISILVPSGILLAVYWARYLLDRFRYGKHVPVIVPLAFTCLFIPKINLINVNRMYSTAGIRTAHCCTSAFRHGRQIPGASFLWRTTAPAITPRMMTGRTSP